MKQGKSVAREFCLVMLPGEKTSTKKYKKRRLCYHDTKAAQLKKSTTDTQLLRLEPVQKCFAKFNLTKYLSTFQKHIPSVFDCEQINIVFKNRLTYT